MWKKVAIGCGAVIVLCVLGFSVASYYVYSKFRAYTQSFQQFAELDKRVANKNHFTAPSNGELTEDSMRRFAAVQESMTAKLGPRIKELSDIQNELQHRQETEHRKATASEVLKVVSDMMGLIVQAKTAQVEALNQSHFSLEEYQWVRSRVWAAAGVTVAQAGLGNLQAALKNAGGAGGDMSNETLENTHDVPPRNKALVKPYLDKMKDWMPFAFFGL